MYAIVKTGGKQYKVAAGDILVTEKLQGEIGDKVELQAIAVVDGTKVVADPAEAGKTKVVATIVDQFKGDKVLVFKFKKVTILRMGTDHCVPPILRNIPVRGILLLLCLLYVMDLNSIQTIH